MKKFSCKKTENEYVVKSSVATDDFVAIDIYHTLGVPVTRDFPVEDFFNVPFSHHVEIYNLSDLLARYYYIHRTAEEHLPVDTLKHLIKIDAYGHREQMPSNFEKAIPDSDQMRKAVVMF